MALGLAFGLLALTRVGIAASDDQIMEDTERESQAQVVKAPDRKVCKKVKVTGSHFRQRVCMKNSDWAEMETESRRRMQQLNSGTTRGSSAN
jgi:hypothetical protein